MQLEREIVPGDLALPTAPADTARSRQRAASILQRSFRRYLSRKQSDRSASENQAAKVIQRFWRSYRDRAIVSVKLPGVIGSTPLEHQAALKIQQALRKHARSTASLHLTEGRPARVFDKFLVTEPQHGLLDGLNPMVTDQAARTIQRFLRSHLVSKRSLTDSRGGKLANASQAEEPETVFQAHMSEERDSEPSSRGSIFVKFAVTATEGPDASKTRTFRFPIEQVEKILKESLGEHMVRDMTSVQGDEKAMAEMTAGLVRALIAQDMGATSPSPTSPVHLDVSPARIERLLVKARTADSKQYLIHPLTTSMAESEARRTQDIYARQRHVEGEPNPEQATLLKSESGLTGKSAGDTAYTLTASKVARVMLLRNQGRPRTWQESKRTPSALRREVSDIVVEASGKTRPEIGKGLRCRCADPSKAPKDKRRGILFLQSPLFSGLQQQKELRKPPSLPDRQVRFGAVSVPAELQSGHQLHVHKVVTPKGVDPLSACAATPHESSPDLEIVMQSAGVPAGATSQGRHARPPEPKSQGTDWKGTRLEALAPRLDHIAKGAAAWLTNPHDEHAIGPQEAAQLALSSSAPALTLPIKSNEVMHQNDVWRQAQVACVMLAQTQRLYERDQSGSLDQRFDCDAHELASRTAAILNSSEPLTATGDISFFQITQGARLWRESSRKSGAIPPVHAARMILQSSAPVLFDPVAEEAARPNLDSQVLEQMRAAAVAPFKTVKVYRPATANITESASL